jgi:hypothetical protein
MTHTQTAQRRFRSRSRRTIAAAATLAALCGGVAVTATAATPAGADSATSIGSLSCDELTGNGATLFLSAATSYPIYSSFLVSVDGGSWQSTNVFFEGGGSYYEYVNGTWVSTIPEQTLNSTVGGTHSVQAEEVTYIEGQSSTYNLGSCETSQIDFSGGGPNGDGITISGDGHVDATKLGSGAVHHKAGSRNLQRSLANAESRARLVPPPAG